MRRIGYGGCINTSNQVIKKKRRKTQIAYGKVETKQKPPPKPEAMNLGAQATG
jgi:hypothetical protein